MWYVALCTIVTLIICIIHWVYSWRNPRCNGKLPPGSMGLPILGETLQFFSPNTSFDVPPFIKKRVERYGSLFRTSLVGQPVIISTDPEVNHFIFQQEGKMFQSWYMESFTEIFGRQSVLSSHGFIHKYLKNLILTIFGIESLKERLLPEVDDTTRKHLHLWTNQESVNLKEAIATMIFDLTAKKLISYDESKSSEKMRENFVAFIQGLISFPLNIPGTVYYKCLQGRKKAIKMLKDMLDERRATPGRGHNDFLDILLGELKKDETILTERIAIDITFVLLFASFETTSAALTLAMKFLGDHPSVLAELTKEHEAILRSRENVDSRITWKEYKSMTFTSMVINETVRLANIVPGVFRKAIKDVEIKGYTIPAGWAVMVCPPAVHLNSAKYDDPLAFNPWRWEGLELNSGSKNFMAFGGGVRLCVGAEFSKLQMAIFLHYLVTKYRWITIKGGDIVRRPGLSFPNELKKDETILTEGIAIDVVFVLLFASFETTSLALTVAMKFLGDHPAVLAELTVINETVRLANITPEVFRKAIKDVEINGYTILARWPVMVCLPTVHLNPAKYEDPLAFNLCRWEGLELNSGSKIFMAFGVGMRLCVGAELSKLQMTIFLHYLVIKYSWRNPRCNGKLPPGSMGLPILGETLQFFSSNTSSDVPPFIKKRMEKYGSLFRTSLVGWPVVVSTDSELNRFIIQQEGKLFQSWYMDSFDDIVGRQNVLSVHGVLHKYLKNLIMNLFGPESLKHSLLPEVEETTRQHLKLWSSQASVDMKEAIANMIFDFTAKKVISYEESKSLEKLRENYAAFLDGLISFPLNIPVTSYHKCLQGRKKAIRMIKNMLHERRASQRQRVDFLDLIVEELEKDGTILTEGIAIDLLFKEHEAILRNREDADSGITWKEYKSMNFTFMVINETIRLANIIPGIFRKAMRDVEINGYTIPAGWAVVVCPPAVHLNPAEYEDPLAFNPWRWQELELNAGSKNFMGFGGGIRLCVGAEFVKLQMAIFLHHLVTKYR
ncbi:hypothetical protein HHK36_000275 [Tetracentron sinense]|uniref:Cytochrome P450 n=1 Tax=Tetracentron sinense TaxID=13715 RepID=A0A834ZRB3_TETSI|nr:hypothetical protein HHK36_000275 [Tetracentron sinense]